MRYRSKAPGRPWVCMTRTPGFPRHEMVQAVRERCEGDGTIHIAATQPYRRIVWPLAKQSKLCELCFSFTQVS